MMIVRANNQLTWEIFFFKIELFNIPFVQYYFNSVQTQTQVHFYSFTYEHARSCTVCNI